MSRFATSGGGTAGGSALRAAASGFVSGQGGKTGAVASSPTGVTAGREVARFLSTVQTAGLQEAARRYGLTDALGQSADSLLSAMAAALSPHPGTDEEAASHAAVVATSAYLFEHFAVAEEGLEALSAITEETVALALEHYVAAYVNSRLMHVLGVRVENGSTSEKEALALEREVKDYVRQCVKLAVRDVEVTGTDWNSLEGSTRVAEIFEAAYGFLEEAE